MNIYHPYDVLADNDDCLHLKESESRERIHFAVFRILPIALLFFLWFVLQQTSQQLPMGWNYFIAGFLIFASALLFLRSYIIEIKILNKKDIFFVQKTVSGAKEQTIRTDEIDRIVLQRRRGRARGAFFYLHTKKGKSFLLLGIPSFYIDEHHVNLIKERLSDMLMVTIQER